MSNADKGNRYGRSARVREYVKAHPSCNCQAIGKALGENPAIVSQAASKMRQQGILLVTHINGLAHYRMGREPLALVLTPEEAVARRKARRQKYEAEYRQKHRKPDPRQLKRDEIAASCKSSRAQVNNQRAETIAEFEARGGKVEPVAAKFCAHVGYGQFHGTMRQVAGFMGSNS